MFLVFFRNLVSRNQRIFDHSKNFCVVAFALVSPRIYVPNWLNDPFIVLFVAFHSLPWVCLISSPASHILPFQSVGPCDVPAGEDALCLLCPALSSLSRCSTSGDSKLSALSFYSMHRVQSCICYLRYMLSIESFRLEYLFQKIKCFTLHLRAQKLVVVKYISLFDTDQTTEMFTQVSIDF